MNRIFLIVTALLVSSTVSRAENPYVGQPANYTAQDKAFRDGGMMSKNNNLDYTAPAEIPSRMRVYRDGSANRFGDASPSSYPFNNF